jgi:5-methylcytosine-specific restriction endonuclease McrA
MSTEVIVLNADGNFLNTVTWQEGVTLLYLRKAEVVAEADRILSNFDKSYQLFLPLVIKLREMVTKIFKPRTGYNKRNVFFRDKFTCQYCNFDFKGSLSRKVIRKGEEVVKRLTIDHVKPRAHGGKTSYENCVASCCACNQRKADRTPDQAFMKLKKIPVKPNIAEFFRMQMKARKIDKRLEELGVY